MNFNYKIYADTIKDYIPNINQHDLAWLCNQAANIYQSLDDGCIDNFRVCEGCTMSPMYEAQFNSGCCGFHDVLGKNPLTGNEFMIGFNYGH